MGYRVVIISADRYAQERLVANSELSVPGAVPDDQVALVAGTEPPVVFGLGRVVRAGTIRYSRRLFDAPLPANGLTEGPLSPEVFAELEAKTGGTAAMRTWLVGVDLPVEADS